MKLLYLRRKDSTTTTTEYLNVPAAALFQQVIHVFKKLDVPTLIGSDCDALCIFLDSSLHYLLRTAIMPQVYHLGSLGLHDAAHDIDSCVMPVKERCSCDYADFICYCEA